MSEMYWITELSSAVTLPLSMVWSSDVPRRDFAEHQPRRPVRPPVVGHSGCPVPAGPAVAGEAREAADTRFDSAPGPAIVSEPLGSCATGFVALLGLALGAAVVILLRAELFAHAHNPPSVKPLPGSVYCLHLTLPTSPTESQHCLRSSHDRGELLRALDSLGKGKDTRQALSAVVQERLLMVVFARASTRAP